MDINTITLIYILVIGAGLGILIDSFFKWRYIPKHWHQVFPAFFFLAGFHIWEKFKNDMGAFITMLFFHSAGAMHAFYLMKAGILYQGYINAIDTPNPKTAKVEAAPTMPEVKTYKPVPQFEQVIALPHFDKERNFAVTLLRMNEYDSAQVDLTEKKWVKTTKKFTRAEFVGMIDKWERGGLIERKSSAKNSPYVVRRWDAVRLVAEGNAL